MVASEYIFKNPDLNTILFSLKDRKLRLNTSEDVQEFVDIINSNQGLTDICLSGNTFGTEAGCAIAAALRNKTNLMSIDMSDVFTSRTREEIYPILEAFSEALFDKEKLEMVDLSDNAFGPDGAYSLRKLLTRNYRIKTLRLNNNGLGSGGVKHISEALLEAMKLAMERGHKPLLRSLTVGRNRAENDGALYLSKVVDAYSGSLQEFCAPQNGINTKGVVSIINSLSVCSDLLCLDLQDNTFLEKGSRALANTVAKWKKLSDLNISDCLLTPEGGKSIIESLSGNNCFMKNLDMQYDDIDSSGAELIPEMLKNKLLLMGIQLNGNAFPPKGRIVDRIRESLKTHNRGAVLGPLDEMEYDSDEEGSEEGSEDEDENEDENEDEDEDEDEDENEDENENKSEKGSLDESQESTQDKSDLRPEPIVAKISEEHDILSSKSEENKLQMDKVMDTPKDSLSGEPHGADEDDEELLYKIEDLHISK